MKAKVNKAGLSSYWYADKIGQVFEVVDYSNSSQPNFAFHVKDCKEGSLFTKDDVEIINEEKQMKREDKINLEMTLQEAAQIYALISRANGTVGYNIYKTLKDILDPKGDSQKKCLEGKFEVFQYMSVQKEFEAAIFDQKSPAQIELETLQTKINELQTQAAKLQELVNK